LIRKILKDELWVRITAHYCGKVGDPGQTGGEVREFVEAVLWIARTDSRLRDPPAEFGAWNSVFKRFRRWVKNGDSVSGHIVPNSI
jgi:transposase